MATPDLLPLIPILINRNFLIGFLNAFPFHLNLLDLDAVVEFLVFDFEVRADFFVYFLDQLLFVFVHFFKAADLRGLELLLDESLTSIRNLVPAKMNHVKRHGPLNLHEQLHHQTLRQVHR